MVGTISNAKGIRQSGSPASRFGTSSVSSPAVSPAQPVAPATAISSSDHRDAERYHPHGKQHKRQHPHHPEADVRVETTHDESGAELTYRFVDTKTGEVIREWPAGEFGKLRDFVCEKHIHLLDKSV